MRPEITRLFWLCQLIGAVPFHKDSSGHLAFRWRHPSTAYFLVMSLGTLGMLALHLRASIYTAFLHDFARAIRTMLWAIISAAMLIVDALTIAKRQKLINFFRHSSVLWEEKMKSDKRYSIAEILPKYWATAFLAFFCVPMGTLIAMNVAQPEAKVFPSTLFCEEIDETKEMDCNAAGIFASVLMQVIWTIKMNGAIIVFDLLPLTVVLGLTKGFDLITEHLDEHILPSTMDDNGAVVVDANGNGEAGVPRCTFNCIEEQQQLKTNPTIIYTDSTSLFSLPPSPIAAKRRPSIAAATYYYDRATVLRRVVRDHIQLQKTVFLFNRTFSSFVIFSVGLVFGLCLVGFFAFFKLNSTDDATDYFFFSFNGIQILLRGVIVLNTYGRLYQSGRRMRRKIQLDVGVLGPLAEHDPVLVTELVFFLETLENLKVDAGYYFFVTHAAIMTLFGLITTYIAVLMQTL